MDWEIGVDVLQLYEGRVNASTRLKLRPVSGMWYSRPQQDASTSLYARAVSVSDSMVPERMGIGPDEFWIRVWIRLTLLEPEEM